MRRPRSENRRKFRLRRAKHLIPETDPARSLDWNKKRFGKAVRHLAGGTVKPWRTGKAAMEAGMTATLGTHEAGREDT